MKRIRSVRVMRICMLTASALFIGIGIWRQEQLEVMNKAVRICLECIGIG